MRERGGYRPAALTHRQWAVMQRAQHPLAPPLDPIDVQWRLRDEEQPARNARRLKAHNIARRLLGLP